MGVQKVTEVGNGAQARTEGEAERNAALVPSAAASQPKCFPLPLVSAPRASEHQEEGSSPEGGRHLGT